MSEIDKAILWMTDGKRNDKFRDKFVGDIDIDVTTVFTYESRLAVHPSLLNRMIEIDLSRYSFTQKLSIVERTPRDSTTVLDVLEKRRYCVGHRLHQELYRCMLRCTWSIRRVKRLSIVCEELEVAYTMGDSIRTSMR
jgi:hypothetical protein